MSNAPDVTLAYADRMLYEAAITGFYGQLTFMFKAGTIVLVRKEETVIPSTVTDDPNRRESLGDVTSAHNENGIRHHR
jgi:hypothetical protein